MAAEEGSSILQTPSYIIAVLLLLFAIAFIAFEKAAADAMTSELMLFGIAALLLSVLEDPITKICIPAAQGGNWYMLSELDGCPCCLKETHYMTDCWLADHQCGLELCNCDGANPSCLAQESSSPGQCIGQEQASQAICGDRPGYKQALSELAIHEIHLYIFWIVLLHIVCSSVMIRVSTWRLAIWKKWMIGDNAHIKAVHQTLEDHAASVTRHSLANGGHRTAEDGTTKPAVVAASEHEADDSIQPARLEVADGRQGRLERAMSQLTAADSMLLSADLLDSSSSQEPQPPVEQPDAQQDSNQTPPAECPQIAVTIRLPSEVLVEANRNWQGRAHTFDQRWEYAWEWLTCFVRQFYFHPISHEEMSIMRASFVLTHRPGKRFVFTDYILSSMDEDFAKVVGLGAPAWIIISLFVLLSGVIGWASAWFVLVAFVIQLGVNTRLVYIARHSTRGGHVHRLERGIFWFGSDGPWVLLILIKAQLFCVAFIYTSQIFFAVNFGPHSCFFVTKGFNSHSLPMPWWVILILNTILYAMLCFVTLPIYSLGVHMGADYKRHIFPTSVQQRMTSNAQDTKLKVKQRQQQDAQQQKETSALQRTVGTKDLLGSQHASE